jgi:hypothetical protein
MNESAYTSLPAESAVVARAFASAVTGIHGDLVKGIYLTGSLALDDYQSGKSDLDFVVLCDDIPAIRGIEMTRQVHTSLAREFPAVKLNGVYITEKHLDVHHRSAVLLFQEGKLTVSDFEMAPVTLLELKTEAITLSGTPASQLRIGLAQKDVNDFLHRNINSYWKGWINQHSSMARKKMLLALFPRLTEWVLLGVARQLYTLRTGKIISKTGAGYYCIEQLPSEFHGVLKCAIDARTDPKKHLFELKPSYYVQLSFKRCNETLTCARFIIDLFNGEYEASGERDVESSR